MALIPVHIFDKIHTNTDTNLKTFFGQIYKAGSQFMFFVGFIKFGTKPTKIPATLHPGRIAFQKAWTEES